MAEVIAIVVIIAIVLGYLVLTALAHLIAAHLVLSLIVICLGIPALIAAGIALLRGAQHHMVVQWRPPELTAGKPELPAPSEPQEIPAVLKPGDVFSADAPAWSAVIDLADREELSRPGKRETRVIAPPCAGPGCTAALDDNPWVIEVVTGDTTEEHSFCSRECVDAWKQQDAASRLEI